MPQLNQQLLNKLRAQLPASVVLEDPDRLSAFAADWTSMHPVMPECVVLPETTEQLSLILALCNEYSQAVVTQGGLTGLSGGATPQLGELALSLSRMRGIIELDPQDRCISVKAGTALQEIQEAAEAAGFKLALDLGARGNCSIGGNLATNAGGNQVIKYGMARAQVLGIEAVRADGTIIRSMNSMLKNNAGYDLKHLFIGSEGTLGIITECVLRLHPAPAGVQTALCGCSSFEAVVELLNLSQAAFGTVSGYEVMWQSYYQYAVDNVEHTRDALATAHPYYVLIETEGDGSEHQQEHFLETLANAMESGTVDDVVVCQNEREREQLWQVRDAIAEILRMLAPLGNFDIGVPVRHMEAFVLQAETELQAALEPLTLLVFGHMGDGNLHLCASSGKAEDVELIHDTVYRIASEYGATITGEHGIGMEKKGYLPLCRSEEEIQLMRELKRTLDPNDILNRGRIFDL